MLKNKIFIAVMLAYGFAYAAPTFTRACEWSGYTNNTQMYNCTACCGNNTSSCEDQRDDCRGECNQITSYCNTQQSTCDNSCLSTYNSCYYACKNPGRSACRNACRNAKDDCNDDCASAETTCLNSNYNFGGSIGVVAGYNACKSVCDNARDSCYNSYGSTGLCGSYCDALPPPPTPTPTPSPTPTPTPVIVGCNPATCCASGFGGYTIDNARGSHAHPAQSTTSFVMNQNKSTNLSIDTTRGSISTIVKKNGAASVQSTAERNASFSQTISNPGIFSGSKPSLFNFGRYKAAAQATGNYFSSWCSFQTSVIQTNQQRYGIVYVDLQKNESCFTSSTEHRITSGSINVIGTFALGLNGFSNINEQRNFKLAVRVPMYINPILGPVTGSTALDNLDYKAFKAQAEAGTFNPTGSSDPYTVAWATTIPAQTGKNPIGVSLGVGYSPFTADEDFPAVMYQDSIFDIEAGINASGAIYTPGFIEIEHWKTPRNTSNFINGALIGGRGMLIGAIREDGQSCTGGTFVSFSPKTIDGLGVYVPSMIRKVGFTVIE